MKEQFEAEQVNTLEELLKDEMMKYEALKKAEEKEDKIQEEINDIFENTEDRAEAEKIINEKYISILKEAVGATNMAFDEWSAAMEKSEQEYEKE